MKIELTQDKYALIDDEDFCKIKNYNWYAAKHRDGGFKAVANVNGKTIYMHRLIMECPDGLVVDHKKHDTLDNRKSELRICTVSDNTKNIRKNNRNTTGYKGVMYRKERNAYTARITVDGKRLYLGYFRTPEEAYTAYCDASKKYHGEYGCVK